MPSSDGPDADATIEIDTLDATGAPIARAPIGCREPTLTVHDGAAEGEQDGPRRTLNPMTATRLDDFAAALAGPIVAGVLARSVAVFVGTALLVLLVRAQGRRSALTDAEVAAISPIVTGVGGGLLTLVTLPAAGPLNALVVGLLTLAAGAIAMFLQRAIAGRRVHTRIAVLGDARSAHDLAWRLSETGQRRFTVVGFVCPASGRNELREVRHISFNVRRLGAVGDLSRIVARNDVDLLVMAGSAEPVDTFERAAICNDRYDTRLLSLASFEEDVFRRVNLDQLDASWFQHVMHPRFRPAPTAVTRPLDIAFALTLGLLTLPLWAPAWMLVRIFFGRPALVTRLRVGYQGRTIYLHRFRVAERDTSDAPPADAVPICALGRLLRRSGVERLPVLLDLLRGDVTLVGPRPVHPRELAAGEREIRFFGRRQLLRPGLTGWAQINGCTDPREEFSADLFYFKHQSLMLAAYVLLISLRPHRKTRP